jgi:RNA polymerase sigma-70 factor (ECF subfamily)
MTADAELLFDRHHLQLVRYLSRAVGEPEVARDVTQDVFLRISRSVVPAASEPEVRAWVFRIARNVALDHHRRAARRPEQAADAHAVVPAATASQDVRVAVNQALSRLTDLDRDIFLLREIVGLHYDEIASVCETSPAAVRSRLHRTRLQLRELLAPSVASRRSAPMRMSGQ